MKYLVILLIIIGAIVYWLTRVYNDLQARMQDIREQLSNLQAALKKRMDLAHQIVDIAKDYGDHEKLTHMTISQNTTTLQNMQLLSQNYPALKANTTYNSLMDKLERLEDQILSQRKDYNHAVKLYNRERNRFPAVLIAERLSFGIAPYYELEDPDFIEKVKIFERDDSETIKQIVHEQTKALGTTMHKAGDKIKQKIGEGQEFAQKKIDEHQAKKEQTDSVHEPSEPQDAPNQSDVPQKPIDHS